MLNDDRIRSLATHRGHPTVTSCYLDVDGREYPRPGDYETQLDYLVRSARSQAASAGAEVARSVEGDLERITLWVKTGFDRSHTRGLAFFGCSAQNWFEVVELPRPVRNEITLDQRPHVRQLESAVQEYERFAVLLVDRQRARLFRFEMGELIEHAEVDDAMPRALHTTRTAEGVARHTGELAHKHLKHAAEVAFDHLKEHPVAHLILGGPHEVVAEFEGLLHSYLRDRVSARLSIGVGSSVDEVRAAALAVEAQIARRHEAELVGHLRNALGVGNGGTAGLESTLNALVERRVGVLLVSDGYRAPGWRCGSCGHLATIGRACPLCATDMELLDDVVEAAVEEALANNCRVQMVRENADLDVLGRIGALLRF